MKRRWVAWGVLVALLVGWRAYRGWIGEPHARLEETWNRGHRIVDRHGEVLRDLPSGIGARGEPTPLDEVGDRLLIATLVSEDKRFYEHTGVDAAAVVRAVGQNVTNLRVVSGASTITQQLVKLLDAGGRPPEEERGVRDKLREAARAQNLEANMTKPEILEAYVNRLSYGRNLVGPKAAAEAFFGVSPKDLSWAQATLMAVLPRAPSYLDPYKHPERGRLRQKALLEALSEQGWLSAEDLERAIVEPLELGAISHPFEAAYLVESLRAGKHGGLEDGEVTTTTIDLSLQREVERVLDGHAKRLLEEGGSTGAAALVVDNATGEILAYAGGQGWSDAPGAHVDMVLARRQPGSTLKPFVYAMSFARGLQPSAMLADVPSRFGEPSGGYAPGNFDGGFVGPVSAREALAGSLNVPAVQLANELQHGELLQTLQLLGLTALDRDASHYGLALALGSGEVPMWQLAEAYVALARGGSAIPLRVRPLTGPRPEGMQVLPSAATAAVVDSLSDPLARVRGLGGSGPFSLGFDVAVKTGTSSGYRDAWTLGFTRERTVAVWVGNPDGERMKELTGGAGAGPIFADVMRASMDRVADRGALFDRDLLVEVKVCPLSGMPVGDACPDAVSRRWIPGAGAEHTECEVHRHAHRAPMRCAEDGASTVVALPDAFVGWLATQPAGAPGRDHHGFPWLAASTVPGCSGTVEVARLRVDDPAPGSVLLSGGGAEVEIAASLLGHDQVEVEFVLDGKVVARESAPYRTHVSATVGDHELLVRPVDAAADVLVARSRFSVR